MNVSPYEEYAPSVIQHLFASVFAEAQSESEGALVGKLVRDLMATTPPQDLYGFCAINGERLVGAIFFSRLRYATGATVFLPSPVAVRSADQSQGIGQQMIALTASRN